MKQASDLSRSRSDPPTVYLCPFNVQGPVWRLAFAPEGHKFARENGFSGRSIHDLVEWLGQHFPLRIKKDPIPGWRRRATRLRSKGNPHLAIATYVDFLNETAQFRQDLGDSCAAAEAEIERQIDEYRSRRR